MSKETKSFVINVPIVTLENYGLNAGAFHPATFEPGPLDPGNVLPNYVVVTMKKGDAGKMNERALICLLSQALVVQYAQMMGLDARLRRLESPKPE